MWKKPESESSQPETSTPPKGSVDQLRERAIIGASISIKGELSGEEDLTIQGKVEGKVVLKNHNITVGRSGRVKADIYGKIISVEGEVDGNLFGEEKIVLRQSGAVRGNVSAPRISLEDGAKFKGSIDMDYAEKQTPRSEASARSKQEASEQKNVAKKEVLQSQGLGFEPRADAPSSKA